MRHSTFREAYTAHVVPLNWSMGFDTFRHRLRVCVTYLVHNNFTSTIRRFIQQRLDNECIEFTEFDGGWSTMYCLCSVLCTCCLVGAAKRCYFGVSERDLKVQVKNGVHPYEWVYVCAYAYVNMCGSARVCTVRNCAVFSTARESPT